jgi:hypothetical protein
MDVTQAVLTALYELMLNDADLAILVGSHWQGPYHRLPVDTAWPYVHHRLDTLEGVDNATRPATYTVEVWDYGDTTDRIWAIRERLMALLDHARFTVPGQGIARLWHSSEAWMPNEDRNVATLALVFTLRYARAGEVRSIQATKGA